jgi:hypothetical protein
MTLRAYLITLRGRIREALCPDLQVLRDRLAYEAAFNNRLCHQLRDVEAKAHGWKGNAENEARLARIDRIDARRGRWMLDKMRHQNCGPHSGWTLTNIYPGDDAAAAIDAAMEKERGDE